MKFGILASHQYLRSDDLGQRLGELWTTTSQAAELDYQSVFAINHFVGNLQTPQTISVLSKLIDVSGDMQVGTSILILPLYHPVHIAEEFATLDHMSGGRLVLGVGAGYRNNEMAAFGIDKGQRFRRMAESVQLIREFWKGERVSHSGDFFAIEDEEISVKPYQVGGPQIWFGAGNDRSIRRAARDGDGWIIPGNSPKEGWFERAIGIHDEELAAAGKVREGRDYPIILSVYVDSDTERAQERARPHLESEYFSYSEYPQLSFQRERFEFLWENRFVIGDPDHVAKRLSWFKSLGVNHVLARMSWLGFPHALTMSSLELFAKEVMPRFR